MKPSRVYKTLMISALLLLGNGAFPHSLSAGELSGVTFANRLLINGRALELNGIGLRKKSIFKVDVYVAGLYLERPSEDEDKILGSSQLKRVEVVFLRNATRAQIIESWKEGFEGNCTLNCQALRPKLDQLNSFMTDVNQNQHVALTFFPERVEITSQGKKRSIEGGDIAKILLATFIGQSPPTEDLKMAMLGKTH
jgi:hypothetical protein